MAVTSSSQSIGEDNEVVTASGSYGKSYRKSAYSSLVAEQKGASTG